MRCCLVALALLLSSCGKPASAEDCEKIVERITELKLAEAKISDPAQVATTVTKTKQTFQAQTMEQCVGRRITDKALACVRSAATAEEIVNECFD